MPLALARHGDVTGLRFAAMSSLRRVVAERTRLILRAALALVLVALTALMLSGAIDVLQSGVLTMLPAIALAAMMLARPYLGERVIGRVRARRHRRSRTAVAVLSALRPQPIATRGGCLIAMALAGRAPPRALALARCR